MSSQIMTGKHKAFLYNCMVIMQEIYFLFGKRILCNKFSLIQL